MKLSGFLTSAGINIALCVVLSILYSILRKQPGNISVYYGQRLAQVQSKLCDPLSFARFVPSTGWIVKAWKTSEEEILAIGGLDAVVFLRIVVFSIRIFSIAAIVCIFCVLPLNYFGQEMRHKKIPSESLDVFTIGNVKAGSRWLWVHCLTLYIISCCACVLLYFDYRSIAKMRLSHVTGSPSNLGHFTVLVRAIPRSSGESYSDVVAKFFTNYYASSYLSHQIVYRSGTVQKLVGDAEKMYKMLKSTPTTQQCGPSSITCGLCGGTANSFMIISTELESREGRSDIGDSNLREKSDAEKMYKMLKSTPTTQQCGPSSIRCGLCGGTTNSFKIISTEPESCEGGSDIGDSNLKEKECAAALVFFRTRYAAMVASQALQSSNPMLWVTDLAPEPLDVFWKNLCIPYRLLWIRRTGTLLAYVVFSFFFLAPVTFVQGLANLDKLQNTFPFMKGIIIKRNFLFELVTGYLPSVILMLFLYVVPPIMILLSAVEGFFSRSGRKKSACLKVLYFLIWNVFFANIMTGTVIERLGRISSPIDVPTQLAKAVPQQAFFFMTYVLTSGWVSLACELMQPFVLICNWLDRLIFRSKGVLSYGTMTFPYHTETARVLLFGLLGFTFSIMAPLILPFLLVYFFLAYLVYRNQILNVYVNKYQSGGLYWPIAHNATIFSLVVTQIIALGVFGLKKSTVASSFMIPLIICTLLFNMYCRQRFSPMFKSNPAQVLIEMDWQDEQSGKMEEIYQRLRSAYCQLTSSYNQCKGEQLNQCENGGDDRHQDSEDMKPEKKVAQEHGSSVEHSHLQIEELNVK